MVGQLNETKATLLSQFDFDGAAAASECSQEMAKGLEAAEQGEWVAAAAKAAKEEEAERQRRAAEAKIQADAEAAERREQGGHKNVVLMIIHVVLMIILGLFTVICVIVPIIITVFLRTLQTISDICGEPIEPSVILGSSR